MKCTHEELRKKSRAGPTFLQEKTTRKRMRMPMIDHAAAHLRNINQCNHQLLSRILNHQLTRIVSMSHRLTARLLKWPSSAYNIADDFSLQELSPTAQ